jgi:hypothetical protein
MLSDYKLFKKDNVNWSCHLPEGKHRAIWAIISADDISELNRTKYDSYILNNSNYGKH